MSLSIKERNERVARVQELLDEDRRHSCYDTDFGRNCFRCKTTDEGYWTYEIDDYDFVRITEILLGENQHGSEESQCLNS